MMPRTVVKAEGAHLLGGVSVVVDRERNKALVWLANAPWGWGVLEREFLNPQSPLIERYVEQLNAKIRAAVAIEVRRKARLREAKRNGGGQ